MLKMKQKEPPEGYLTTAMTLDSISSSQEAGTRVSDQQTEAKGCAAGIPLPG